MAEALEAWRIQYWGVIQFQRVSVIRYWVAGYGCLQVYFEKDGCLYQVDSGQGWGYIGYQQQTQRGRPTSCLLESLRWFHCEPQLLGVLLYMLRFCLLTLGLTLIWSFLASAAIPRLIEWECILCATVCWTYVISLEPSEQTPLPVRTLFPDW